LIASASGGAFGRWHRGMACKKLFYLPEPHTDFILSIIAEESGFIGVTVVIIMFALFAFRGFMIASKAPDLFGTLVAAGITMVISLEAFINIAGVMGLIPLKGLVLPFFELWRNGIYHEYDGRGNITEYLHSDIVRAV